ncbi:putative Serine-threonine protein kinase plant-type [Tripterygium wilfordii]|uniref:Putative Serine-threonine protein kinase plant-type n=1 Tax=Tripterygium wilfordii TaxID=458696 RepID=A0A7J7D080_TRIWF|nr:putative Serine-threonine protein kinase plant-type [Tripterygium wilfordii]
MPPTININTSSLRHLIVNTNNMSGHLPLDMFYDLPQLEYLYLHENMYSGRIPPSLFLCKQLVYLSLGANNFQGSIPEEIRNLTRLQGLYLGPNNFNAYSPSMLMDLSIIPLVLLATLFSHPFSLSAQASNPTSHVTAAVVVYCDTYQPMLSPDTATSCQVPRRPD